jgi:hypothetical protein
MMPTITRDCTWKLDRTLRACGPRPVDHTVCAQADCVAKAAIRTQRQDQILPAVLLGNMHLPRLSCFVLRRR